MDRASPADLMTSNADDDDLLAYAGPATRMGVANYPTSRTRTNESLLQDPSSRLRKAGSALRASAAASIPPAASRMLPRRGGTTESTMTGSRTTSGTPAAKSDTARNRVVADSPYSTRSHTPPHTSYIRRYTPSPIPSCRSSSSSSSSRVRSPLSYRSVSSRAASPLQPRIPLHSSASTSSPRRGSYGSLPGLENSQDTFESSPPTSLSSRNTPITTAQSAGIVVTSDEDVDRLFRFAFKPADYEGKDCGVLIDIAEKTESNLLLSPAKETVKAVDKEAKEPNEQVQPKSNGVRATLVSVTPIDADLVDLSEPAHTVTASKATSTASIFEKIRSISEQQARAAVEKRATSERFLVDLIDDHPGMGRVPIEQALKNLQNGFSFTKPFPLGMSVPGPSRPSNGRRPESPRQPRVPRPNRQAKDRRQAPPNGQLVDLDTDLGSVIPRTQGRPCLGQVRPSSRARDVPTATHSRPSSPHQLNSVISEKYKTISPYRQLVSRKYPQRTIPPGLLDPNQKDRLQWSLMKAWKGTEPKEQQKEYITQLLELLSDMINERLSTPGASREKGKRRFEVDVFGSVSWGGATGASGDLDLIVLDHQMPSGFHPSKWRIPPGIYTTNSSKGPRTPLEDLPAVYRMRAVERELVKIGMRETMPIISATTPIVKFKEPSGQMECDINVNDLGGWYNSSLILHYCLISPHVLRPMIYALKLWAKAFDLNDPSGARGPATMSSYCLTLMAIGYLQHRGILPNLQAGVKAEVPSDNTTEEADVIWVGWGKDQGIKAHIGFDRSPPPGWKPARSITAADAVRGFFAYFNKFKKDDKSSKDAKAKQDQPDSTDRYNYNTSIVSILQGGIAKRLRPPGGTNREEALLRSQMIKDGQDEQVVKDFFKKRREEQDAKDTWIGKGDGDMQPRAWEEKTLIVQDPFLWQKNCAAALSKDGGSRFFDALELTDQLLKSNPNVTLDEVIIDPLASSRVARTPTPRRGSPFGYSRGGRGRGGAGVFDGSRTNSPFSAGRGRGSPYDPAWRGTGGRGRGRGGVAGGAGRGESLLDRLDI